MYDLKKCNTQDPSEDQSNNGPQIPSEIINKSDWFFRAISIQEKEFGCHIAFYIIKTQWLQSEKFCSLIMLEIKIFMLTKA